MSEVAGYRTQETVGSEDANIVGGGPMIIAETTMAIPELTVSMAVTRMDISGRGSLFFRNAATGRLNAVYRREDGNIGWIDPPVSS